MILLLVLPFSCLLLSVPNSLTSCSVQATRLKKETAKLQQKTENAEAKLLAARKRIDAKAKKEGEAVATKQEKAANVSKLPGPPGTPPLVGSRSSSRSSSASSLLGGPEQAAQSSALADILETAVARGGVGGVRGVGGVGGETRGTAGDRPAGSMLPHNKLLGAVVDDPEGEGSGPSAGSAGAAGEDGAVVVSGGGGGGGGGGTPPGSPHPGAARHDGHEPLAALGGFALGAAWAGTTLAAGAATVPAGPSPPLPGRNLPRRKAADVGAAVAARLPEPEAEPPAAQP